MNTSVPAYGNGPKAACGASTDLWSWASAARSLQPSFGGGPISVGEDRAEEVVSRLTLGRNVKPAPGRSTQWQDLGSSRRRVTPNTDASPSAD
jgi:hypothetical protein